MMFTRIFVVIVLLNSCWVQGVFAEETDQFTLPPGELQDIGPFASNRLYEVLEEVIAQTNSEIRGLLPRAPHSKIMAAKLANRRSASYLADLVYKKTGPGFPRWLRSARASSGDKPIMYKELRPWKNVYWLAFSQSPMSFIELAPTINMFGYYFGTDKLGHFFMQGHTYYSMYHFFLNHGQSEQQAHDAIVTYGEILETSYLGILVNGVYSNGDLSANYSGWKFYSNIGHSVKIGDKTLPPLLVLKGDQWEFSKGVDKDTLLKPYLTDNLNEAYNPCYYTFTRNQIRKQVKKRCADWVERTGITKEIVAAKLYESRRWHDEDYGHKLPLDKAVTLDVCFGGQ